MVERSAIPSEPEPVIEIRATKGGSLGLTKMVGGILQIDESERRENLAEVESPLFDTMWYPRELNTFAQIETVREKSVSGLCESVAHGAK